jgi:hypothetical protein
MRKAAFAVAVVGGLFAQTGCGNAQQNLDPNGWPILEADELKSMQASDLSLSRAADFLKNSVDYVFGLRDAAAGIGEAALGAAQSALIQQMEKQFGPEQDANATLTGVQQLARVRQDTIMVTSCNCLPPDDAFVGVTPYTAQPRVYYTPLP